VVLLKSAASFRHKGAAHNPNTASQSASLIDIKISSTIGLFR